MSASISFFSTLRTVSSYMPPIRCCFKHKKQDVLLQIYRKLTSQKPQKFNPKVAKIIKSITDKPYSPYSSSAIVQMNYLMTRSLIEIINGVRLMVSDSPQYNPHDKLLTLSPQDVISITQQLLTFFPADIDLEQKTVH